MSIEHGTKEDWYPSVIWSERFDRRLVKLASMPAGILPLMLIAKKPPAMLPASGSTPQSLSGTFHLLLVYNCLEENPAHCI